MLLLLIEGSLDLKYGGKRRVKKKRGHMAVILQVVSPPCRGSMVPMRVTYTTEQLWFPAIPLTKPTTALSFFPSFPCWWNLPNWDLEESQGIVRNDVRWSPSGVQDCLGPKDNCEQEVSDSRPPQTSAVLQRVCCCVSARDQYQMPRKELQEALK